MQLAISVLGKKNSGFIGELLSAISICHCNIVEFNTTNISKISTAYVLIDGNWNCIAKLENMLETLRERYELQISLLRPDDSPASATEAGVPYTLETISMDKHDLLLMIASFLLDRGVIIEEINASLQPAMMFSNQVFSSRFLLLVPPSVRILSLREEFLDFCDSINIDAILEPIKR